MVPVHNSIGSFSHFIRYSDFIPSPSRNIFFTLHEKDILKISYPSLCDQISNRISDRVSGPLPKLERSAQLLSFERWVRLASFVTAVGQENYYVLLIYSLEEHRHFQEKVKKILGRMCMNPV